MEEILIGVTDRTIPVWIPDPASTTGQGKTGLVAANITVKYTRYETDNDVVLTDATGSLSDLSALTDAHADWGWKEVGGGEYRLDVADAVFASGAWYAVVKVNITTGTAAMTPKAFRLVAVNALDTVRMGLTALPNAAADAAGGLPISDAGGLDMDARLDAAMSSRMATYTQPTGFLSATFPAGTVANTTNITAGTITTVTNLTNAPTAGDLTATMKTSVTTAATAATPIAASVTGAVGSVTGLTAADVGAIKTVTDALPNAGALTTIQADLDNIQTRIPAALITGRMDVTLTAIGDDTTALTAFKRGVLGNVVGTCAALGSTTSIITSALTPAGAAADQFKGRILTFDKDTTTTALRGQATDITASTNAATPTFTVTALTTAPVSGDTFVVT